MITIHVRYYGPTNTKGACLRATTDSGGRHTVPFNHSLSIGDNYRAAAEALAADLEAFIIAGATFKSDWVFIANWAY